MIQSQGHSLANLQRITNYPPLLNREQVKLWNPKKQKQDQKISPLLNGHRSMSSLIVMKESDQLMNNTSIPTSSKLASSNHTQNSKSLFIAQNIKSPKKKSDPIVIPFMRDPQKSKTIAFSQQRRDSDFSSALSRNDYSSPREGSASPGWARINQQNESFGQEALSLNLAKQSLDIMGVKLEKNFMKLKEGIQQRLSSLEREAKLSGNNLMEMRKSKQIIESLVGLVADTALNELKLAQSGAESTEKSGQISIQKKKIDQLNSLLIQGNKEIKVLTEAKDQLEQTLIQKNKEISILQKVSLSDNKRIESLEKKLQFVLETGLIEYASHSKCHTEGNSSLLSHKVSMSNVSHSQQQESKHPNLRAVIAELIKENESLRKKAVTLEAEMGKLKESENTLSQNLSQCQSKIETMKKKISEKDLEQIQVEERQILKKHMEDKELNQNSGLMLKNMQIPKDSDFRLSSIKFDFSQILMDIIEHGSSKFAVHVSRNKNVEKRTKLISFLAGQFISYREFSNRLVELIKHMHALFLLEDLNEIQFQISCKFAELFKSQFSRLWIKNAATGLLYTINKENRKIMCLPGKGIFNEVIVSKQSGNFKKQSQNIQLYIGMTDVEDNSSTQMILTNSLSPIKLNNHLIGDSQHLPKPFNCQNSICLPIIIKEEVIGIFEISESCQSEGFSQEEEMFSVVCANFFTLLINNLKTQRFYRVKNKISSSLEQCFQQCIAAPSLLNLEKTVKKQLRDYFGIQNSKLYFYKNPNNNNNNGALSFSTSSTKFTKEDEIFKIYSLVEKTTYSYKKGVIGESICNQKQIISQQISKESSYDPFIDLKTLLPTFTIPLLIYCDDQFHQVPVGVLQVPLKRRNQIQRKNDELLLGSTPLLGIDDNLERVLESYAGLISSAIKFRFMIEDMQQSNK